MPEHEAARISRLRPVVALLAGSLAVTATAAATVASPWRLIAAVALIYAGGYVTGALVVAPAQDRARPSLAVVRLVAGLQLTAIAFLGSLLASIPWFVGPVGVFGAALARYRVQALTPPRWTPAFSTDGAAAALLMALLLAPPLAAWARMAAGPFPPVFFHVDTPYFLEKVHALAGASAYPPESLGNAGGRFAYHFGAHAIPAAIARASGLAPHHALFLLALPLLAGGLMAAGVVVARQIAASLPWIVTLPLLMTTAPTLWYPFWSVLGPAVAEAVSLGSREPLLALPVQYELWGVTSNQGQNMASAFLVVASIAGIIGADSLGYRLPVFLVGTAILFKAPTGIALLAGFGLVQVVRAVITRRLHPLLPAVCAAAFAAAVYLVFWTLPAVSVDYQVFPFAFYHLGGAHARGQLAGFVADLAWLLLPAMALLHVSRKQRDGRSLALALLALAPLVVVNALRSIDLRPDRDDNNDWLQILVPVPLLLHAFVLSSADARWPRAGRAARLAFFALVALAVVPPLAATARYAGVLVTRPDEAHEFADNAEIAEALAVIPREGALIVTNDLRYPANGFSRPGRQMQIPAIYGHRAFAVNYAYESFSFSRERQTLQRLLETPDWSTDISSAARSHGWTHLLIRKDHVHPTPIPLTRVFDAPAYAVYVFSEP